MMNHWVINFRSCVSRLSVGIVFLFVALSARAGGSSKNSEFCGKALKDSAQSIRGDLLKSEALRNIALGHIELAIRQTETMLFEKKSELKTSMLRRSDLRKDIPNVAKETLEILEKSFGPSANREIAYSQRLKDARTAISTDPYFVWLKSHAVDNRSVKKDYGTLNLQQSDGQIPSLVFDEVPSDPEALFFYNLNISGPSFLPPELNLFLVYRELDPEVNPQQIQLANEILALNKLRFILYADMKDFYSSRSKSMGAEDAWNLVPSVEEGKLNLESIKKATLAKYSSRFPKTAYERLKRKLEDSNDKDLQLIRQYNYDARNGIRHADTDEAHFRNELVRIGREFELPESFGTSEISDTLGNAMRYSHMDYFSLLIATYETNATHWMLSHLDRIVNELSAMSDEKKFSELLFEKVRKGNFRY